MKKLVKKEIAINVSENAGVPFSHAASMVDFLFNTIIKESEAGARVSLMGIGDFYYRDKPKREGRNPATGEIHEIKARRTLCLALSYTLKQEINREVEA